MPDYAVKLNIQNDLEPKCFVAYFPVNICQNLIDSIIVETTLQQMTLYLDYESYLSKPNFEFGLSFKAIIFSLKIKIGL